MPSDKTLWTIDPVKCPSSAEENGDATYDIGVDEWDFAVSVNGDCMDEIDLATGQVLDEQSLPAGWREIAPMPSLILEWGAGTLGLYHTTDLSTPIWSQPATHATPVAVGQLDSLVDAPAGWLILSNKTGAIVAHGHGPDNGASGGSTVPWQVVDGAIVFPLDDASPEVVELDPRR